MSNQRVVKSKERAYQGSAAQYVSEVGYLWLLDQVLPAHIDTGHKVKNDYLKQKSDEANRGSIITGIII